MRNSGTPIILPERVSPGDPPKAEWANRVRECLQRLAGRGVEGAPGLPPTPPYIHPFQLFPAYESSAYILRVAIGRVTAQRWVYDGANPPKYSAEDVQVFYDTSVGDLLTTILGRQHPLATLTCFLPQPMAFGLLPQLPRSLGLIRPETATLQTFPIFTVPAHLLLSIQFTRILTTLRLTR